MAEPPLVTVASEPASVKSIITSDSTNNTTTPADAPKLTGAEMKKKAKEEKAARRAQAQQEKQAASAVPMGQSIPPAQKSGHPKPEQQRKTGAKAGEASSLPIRGAHKSATSPAPEVPQEEDKTVEFFRHLNRPKKTSISEAGKDVHQAVLTVGLQMAAYTLCGSSARLVATLLAFKEVIASFRTPAGTSLKRHLTTHVLSPNIDYLSSCRPLSISMGNAIRWLKLEIAKVDVDVPDSEAKESLCLSIDAFIHERVTVADKVIASAAADKIKDGDVILTYGKSSVVQRALVIAHAEGKQFRVIVADTRPLHEGQHLATALTTLGLEVKYCYLNGLVHNMKDATKVFLGAHAMMSNGRLFSRVGTAIVAMEAKIADIPVLVLCETIKFTDRVALDSIVHNEVAPPDELVIPGGPLQDWRNVKGLQLLNLMYDVTPADFIQIVISEAGSVPPTSVPTLNRSINENE